VPLTDENGNLIQNKAGDHSAIQAEDGFETPLQHLSGGAVLRTRKSDGQVLAPLSPRESRTFGYSMVVPAEAELEVTVRLLFRHLPGYFLRQLAFGQPEDEEPRLAPLIENLEIVEMARVSQFLRTDEQ
jgi:hypothetical protein